MANDDLLENLYNFHWYKLPTKYQKMIGQVIHRRQNAGVITMGPFRQLNYETSADVCRNIYDLFLLIKNIEIF